MNHFKQKIFFNSHLLNEANGWKLLGNFLILAGLFSFSGCSFLKTRDLPKAYKISVSRETTEKTQKGEFDSIVIEVLPFSSNKPFDSTLIQILGDNKVWKEDYYNRIFISPDILISQDLRKWLSDTEAFKNVSLPITREDTNVVIHGNVEKFFINASNPKSPASTVSLKFSVTWNDDTKIENEVTQSFKYESEIPIPGLKTEYVIEGLEIALEEVFRLFEQDLYSFLSGVM